MTRTFAQALALVNWKGVFYERYLLDRHVTALEGANGAGKTTVMIAAYVVLLPDMSRLRFTNLGETGATGGDRGIWGRLGETGRPSYAALELALARRRASSSRASAQAQGRAHRRADAVHRHQARPDARLQDLCCCVATDTTRCRSSPSSRRPRSASARRSRCSRAAKDYFTALFERGVTPLRALERRRAPQAQRDAAHQHDRRHLAR